MPEKIGTVTALSKGRVVGDNTYYGFCIDDVWYNTATTKTQAERGYQVKFTYTTNQKGFHDVDLSTFKFKEGEAPPPQNKSYGGGKKSSYDPAESKRREAYWAEKEARDVETQKRIGYNAAMNTSITIINAALDREILAPIKGKASDRLVAYQAIIEEETKRVFQLFQTVPDRYDDLMGVEVEEEKVSEFDVEVAENDFGTSATVVDGADAW